jgi:anti-sigma factor RsiW
MEDLSAYVDGALQRQEELALRFHLDDCAACRQKVKTLLALKETVTRSTEFHPVPDALRESLSAQVRSSRWLFWRHPWGVRPGLALVLLFAVASVAGWWWQQSGERRQYKEIAQALVAEHIHYVYLPDALEIASADPVTITTWFQSRVPFPVHVPHLQDVRLLGGRLCSPLGYRGAVVFYEREGKRLSLFTLAVDVLPPRERKELQVVSQERPKCFKMSEGRPLCLMCSKETVRAVVMDGPEMEEVAVGLFRSP